MAKSKAVTNAKLYNDIASLIESSKKRIAQTANATLTFLYWKIGQTINHSILENKRAAYGKQIVVSLSRQLTIEYGASFSEKNIRRMMQFAEVFPDEKIVATLLRQLSWSHFTHLITIKDELKREFYSEMCRSEQWSVRLLKEKLDSLLYERTAISKKPAQLIKKEIADLRDNDILSPDLVFKDPYFLNLLGLKDTYSEKNLEDAILKKLEIFLLELGHGFSFIERQKRIIIDGEDFKIDLLFFHRKLKRLIAIELKLGKFKAAYKGQMELYLRWLQKYEMQEGEEQPLGLILCTQGNSEQIELLQLEKSGIKVAEYLTELPKKQILRKKLNEAIKTSQKQIENHEHF